MIGSDILIHSFHFFCYMPYYRRRTGRKVYRRTYKRTYRTSYRKKTSLKNY